MWEEFEFNDPFEGNAPESVNGAALPLEYIDFMKKHNGGEGDTGESWLMLYPIEDLQEINEDYETEKLLPGCVIIGNNGASELFGISKNGQYFIVPDIIEEEYLQIIGENIENLPDDINRYWSQQQFEQAD